MLLVREGSRRVEEVHVLQNNPTSSQSALTRVLRYKRQVPGSQLNLRTIVRIFNHPLGRGNNTISLRLYRTRYHPNIQLSKRRIGQCSIVSTSNSIHRKHHRDPPEKAGPTDVIPPLPPPFLAASVAPAKHIAALRSLVRRQRPCNCRSKR